MCINSSLEKITQKTTQKIKLNNNYMLYYSSEINLWMTVVIVRRLTIKSQEIFNREL